MTEKEFIAHWIKKIRADKKKFFPEDYLGTTQTTELSVPPKVLLLGNTFLATMKLLQSMEKLFILHSLMKKQNILFTQAEIKLIKF
ncbi:MAG: hypothetical protein C0425_03730 [Chlorobiaceae bacterium]|nr:hypothetical protein [Chlorobiaceae bacterium]MBA4309425.1 hypothetical protein [Chlorobiaceae bacterium]